ncbi:hypothetical protein [Phreatobacter stygius]|uniref:hypothetical protein n=1 Tax=Phreatobacter stygius TaxID=1940610 RepID=UPI001476E8AD|nr:hypothetical protein [Phreatobacter stygius]
MIIFFDRRFFCASNITTNAELSVGFMWKLDGNLSLDKGALRLEPHWTGAAP